MPAQHQPNAAMNESNKTPTAAPSSPDISVPELKPCPFCGRDPGIIPCPNPSDEGYFVCCLCGAGIMLLHPTAESAASVWNTRTCACCEKWTEADEANFQKSLMSIPRLPSYLKNPIFWMFLVVLFSEMLFLTPLILSFK